MVSYVVIVVYHMLLCCHCCVSHVVMLSLKCLHDRDTSLQTVNVRKNKPEVKNAEMTETHTA